MKKILCFVLLLASAALSFAISREELVFEASYAGLSFKNSTKYADLSLLKEESGLTEKEQKKLDKLSAKVSKGTEKFSQLEKADSKKAAKKKARIRKHVIDLLQREAAIYAYEDYIYKNEKTEEIPINPKTGFPEILSIPFVTFQEGAAFSMVTRIQKENQYNRSNFVWQDYLIGAYFDINTINMKPFNNMIRVSVFYPFHHTFNGMQQFAKQTILYAFDLYAGPTFQFDLWNYVYLNFSSGLHYMYQLSDEYHLNYLGVEVLGGLELPLARRWTILLDGSFTLDYPNFGTNKKIQPFDYSWQYQAHLGVRYSKKKMNKYAYIHKKINTNDGNSTAEGKKADSDSKH